LKENALQRSLGGDRENAVGPPLPSDPEGSRRLRHPPPVPPHPAVVAPNDLAPLRGAMREEKVDAALLVLTDTGGAREEDEELGRAGSGRRRRRSLRRARHAPAMEQGRGGLAALATPAIRWHGARREVGRDVDPLSVAGSGLAGKEGSAVRGGERGRGRRGACRVASHVLRLLLRRQGRRGGWCPGSACPPHASRRPPALLTGRGG
jgi:hypothetical protein